MDRPRCRPTEQQWLQHKPALRHLWLVLELPLSQLVTEAANLGLNVTKSQMEYKLKQWGFRRNIDKPSWVYIDHNISKRKVLGKRSEVIHCGRRLKSTTVEKETNRYRDTSIFSRLPSAPSPTPTSPIGTEIIVCTPPTLSMEFEWPQNLPWFEFKKLNIQFMSRASGNGPIDNHLLEALKSQFSTSMTPGTDLMATDHGRIELQPQISRLAALLGASLPEMYPGENLQRSAIILNGTCDEVLQEFWMMMIYKISNNLLDLTKKSHWDSMLGLVREYRLLNFTVDLQQLRDKTVRTFMSALLGGSIYRILDDTDSSPEGDAAWEVFRWLVSCGHSLDVKLFSWDMEARRLSDYTPLQAAIEFGNLELTEQLLRAGADPNFTLKSGSVDQVRAATTEVKLPLEHSLDLRGPSGSATARIFKALLDHGASANINRMLYVAILRRDIDLATDLFQRGANPATVQRQRRRYICEETALTGASFMGLEETQCVLYLLMSQEPWKTADDFLTADVFISAAAGGQDEIIRYLDRIYPNWTVYNDCHATPLHVAAMYGRLSTCKLLLRLRTLSEYSLVHPSHLHLASYFGEEEITRFLLDNGANVNEAVSYLGLKVYDTYFLDHRVEDQNFTPLQLIWNERFYGRKSCAPILIQAGAEMTGQELLESIRRLDADLLDVALAAGADPDTRRNDSFMLIENASALQLACYYLQTDDNLFARHAVAALLQYGAKFRGGEVISAIRSGDWDVVGCLLASGGSFDPDSSGMSALSAAVCSPKPDESIDRLFEHGFNEYDSGALCEAINLGSESVMSKLLQLRQSYKQATILDGTALGLAAKSGDMNLVRMLLDRFTFSNLAMLPFTIWKGNSYSSPWCPEYWRLKRCAVGSLLSLSVMSASTEALKELLAHGFQPDRLTWFICANQNNLEAVQILFDHGQRFDDDTGPTVDCKTLRCNPISEAVVHQNKALILLLLKAGSDANETCFSSRHHSRCGGSPLQEAVAYGNIDTVNCLLEAGADINAPPTRDGGTALQFAATQGFLGLAKHLIDLGADVHARAAWSTGRSALEGAAQNGRIDMLTLLLHHSDLTTKLGRLQYIRAVILATEGGRYAAAEILTSFGGWTKKDEALKKYQSDSGSFSSYDKDGIGRTDGSDDADDADDWYLSDTEDDAEDTEEQDVRSLENSTFNDGSQ